MISGLELNYNILYNKEFVYDYVSKIKNRIITFESRIDKTNTKNINKAEDYIEFIDSYKNELVFIYKQMREHPLKLIDSLDSKYIKSLFKKVFITYDTNDRIPLKKYF